MCHLQLKTAKPLCFGLRENRAINYMGVCDYYNRCILAHIEKVPKDSYMLLNLEELIGSSRDVINRMKSQWGFTSINHVDIEDVFNPTMMGKKKFHSEFKNPISDQIKKEILDHQSSFR